MPSYPVPKSPDAEIIQEMHDRGLEDAWPVRLRCDAAQNLVPGL
jgi:hypothetical protein